MNDTLWDGYVTLPTGRAKGEFERHGHIDLLGRDAKKLEAVGWPSRTNIINKEWLEYESFDDISTYTISIV
jgi:hypothetical protein